MCVGEQMLLRTHDAELDQLMRQNRQSQEKLAATQVAECKALQKKLRTEQVRATDSTTCALVDFTYRVHTLLESNRYVRCVLIDFSKAFDMVDHVILARKLYRLHSSFAGSCPSLLTEHKPPNLAFTSRRRWPLTGQSFEVLALDQYFS